MVWALLPITLQQVCSFSYDSQLFALCILVIATTMSAVYGQETNRRSKLVNNIVMVLSSLLLLPCKGFSLLPLVVLLLMLIPRILQQHKDKVDAVKQKIKPWMKVLMIVIAGIFVVACVMVLVLVVRRWLQPENINSTYIAWSDSKGYTMGYFLKIRSNFLKYYSIRFGMNQESISSRCWEAILDGLILKFHWCL